ncbi:hypothetical protein HK100_012069 [Physocladia obscura]|uniref:Peptide hydrolase n=1 Tax=Physocladia obscura TaxID=109957 RepID=A0AAD5XCS3_9FUNG|nr:hypothetical protein HK100_012069 [Physocladia obscura]
MENENTPLIGGDGPVAEARRRRLRQFTLGGLFGFIAVLALGLGRAAVGLAAGAASIRASSDRVEENLLQLQRIAAAARGGSRSVGDGFNASAAFVVAALANDTQLKVWTEELLVKDQVDYATPLFSAASLRARDRVYSARLDFLTAFGSGSGTVTDLPLVIVPGCDPKLDSLPDYPFVALILEAAPPTKVGCDNCLCGRVSLAIKGGAKAVLLAATPISSGYPRPLAPSGRFSCPPPYNASLFASLPILSLGQEASWDIVARALDTPSKPTVSISTNTEYKTLGVVNVLAESRTGSDDSVIIFGSHLDSVRAGPGVNDDGSGAMATLELARAFSAFESKNGKSVQKVRFAWWSAEEIGLLGSKYHIKTLQSTNPAQLAKYKLTIDIDMIASPNYIRGIWDGHSIIDPRIARASARIASVFQSHFTRKGLPTSLVKFNGGSDFQPFMDAGVPAGGVITGENEIKTAEEAAVFGGVAGVVLDPNYHQTEDTVEGFGAAGRAILKENLEALVNALQVFALENNLDAFLKA